jgi:hypothetical protein
MGRGVLRVRKGVFVCGLGFGLSYLTTLLRFHSYQFSYFSIYWCCREEREVLVTRTSENIRDGLVQIVERKGN